MARAPAHLPLAGPVRRGTPASAASRAHLPYRPLRRKANPLQPAQSLTVTQTRYTIPELNSSPPLQEPGNRKMVRCIPARLCSPPKRNTEKPGPKGQEQFSTGRAAESPARTASSTVIQEVSEKPQHIRMSTPITSYLLHSKENKVGAAVTLRSVHWIQSMKTSHGLHHPELSTPAKSFVI